MRACEYQRLKKMSSWEIFDFQCIYLTKLQNRPSLKSFRTFVMITDDSGVGVFIPASQIYTNLCHCSGCSPFQFFQSKKNKLTWTISSSNKVLMNIHHDAPNSHIPGINFLQFLVHALSSNKLWYLIVILEIMPVKAILYLQKIISIYW